jgi:hypothetical protein
MFCCSGIFNLCSEVSKESNDLSEKAFKFGLGRTIAFAMRYVVAEVKQLGVQQIFLQLIMCVIEA